VRSEWKEHHPKIGISKTFLCVHTIEGGVNTQVKQINS